MAMTSATTRVWYVLIDHEGKPMGTLDEITVTDTLSVAGLRTKIQEKERHGLSHFDARQLTLFECADSTSNLKDSDKSGLPNILDRVFSSNAVQELLSTQEIATLQLQNKTVIVLVPDIPQNVRKRDDSDVGGPPEAKLLKREFGHGAPSSLAHASEFSRIVGPGHAVDCNRPVTCDSLPIEFHHEAFGRFKTRCRQPPSTNALAFLDKLSSVACIWHKSELFRRDAVKRLFEEYTDFNLDPKPVPETTYTTDGHLEVNIMPAAIRECKNEFGEGYNQVIVYYTKFLQNTFDPSYWNLNTRFPCVLMVDEGPILGFYGAIWDGQIRAEVLATFDLRTHLFNEEGRFAIASGLDAFKETVDEIQDHYKKIRLEATGTAGATEYDRHVTESRKYPYVTSFEINGQELPCTYRSRLHQEKLVFSAIVNQPNLSNYAIKFTRRYSAEAHQCLAAQGLAPALWQCKDIPGGWTVVIMDKSEYSLLHGQTLTNKYKKQVRSKVIMALKMFHDAGYVHGDIRDTNLLVPVDFKSLASNDANNVKVHFIDFDWAGKAGEVKYPIGVNVKSVKWPNGVGGGVLITRQHDEIMATYLCKT